MKILILNLPFVLEKGCFTARNVLWYLVFTGFAVNYMTRTNLNIAIVSMLKTPPKTKETVASECFNATTTPPVTLANHFHNISGDYSEVIHIFKL